MGDVLLRLSDVSGFNPGVWVVAVQILAYGIFFLFSFLLLRRERDLPRFSLLVFSPFIFTFQLNDLQGGYRKEILYFAALAFLVWASRSCGDRVFRWIYILLMALFPLLILSHEMLVIVLPWFPIIYLLRYPVRRKSLFFLALGLIPAGFAAVFSIMHPGLDIPLRAIVDAVSSRGFEISESSAIKFLHWDLLSGFQSVVDHIGYRHYLRSYSLVLLLSGIPFLLLRDRIRKLLENRWVLFGVSLSVLGTVLLCALAADWGRFIYMQLVSLFLALPAVDGNDRPIAVRGGVMLWGLPVLLYLVMWHIPHFGGSVIARSFSQTTLGAPMKTYQKVCHLLKTREVPLVHR